MPLCDQMVLPLDEDVCPRILAGKRVSARQYLDALAEPFTEEFDITGKPLTGWVMVNPEGLETEAALAEWIGRAMAFVKSLPAK